MELISIIIIIIILIIIILIVKMPHDDMILKKNVSVPGTFLYHCIVVEVLNNGTKNIHFEY